MTSFSEQPTLPIYRIGTPERWKVDSELDRLLNDALSHEVIWAIRPALSHVFSAPADALSRTGLRRRLLRATEYGSSAPRVLASLALRRMGVSRPRTLYALVEDGCLKIWTSENHRVSLLGDQAAQKSRRIVVPARTNQSLAKDTRNIVYDVAAQASLPADELLRIASQAASTKERMQRLMDEAQPKAVLTASTQHSFCRLSVSVGRSLGVPSIYVPHAPTSFHRHYADIPHDYAALRGEADFEYYARLGANTKYIAVVGDQSISPTRHRPTLGPPVILLATTVEKPLDKLRSALEALHDSGIRRFATTLMAPHPRGRARVASLARHFDIEVIPRGTRSSQVLARTNVILAVVEESSGVSLECMAHGVPVVLLSSDSSYIFETELPIDRVKISNLTAILQSFMRENCEEVRAEASVRRFIAATGAAAKESLRELLLGPIVTTPSGVLDSWRWEQQ